MLPSNLDMVGSLVVEQIKRFEVDFLNSMTRVKILVEGQKIRTGSGAMLEPKPGTIVEVKRWVAEELVQSGFAIYQDDTKLDRVSLSRLRWLETSVSSDSIRPILAGFYPRARRLLQAVKDKSPDLSNEVDATLRETVNARVRKILRLAIAPSLPADIYASMQPEELFLYNLISGCLSSWKEGILGA